MKISEEMIEAVQKANHYALDDALIRRVLEPALQFAAEQQKAAEVPEKR